MKEIKFNKTYTIFDILKEKYINWTGYDSNFLDEIASTGNELIEENEMLKTKVSELRLAKKHRILEALHDFFTGFESWKTIGMLIIFILALWLMIQTIINDDAVSEKMGISYKQGQVDALTNENILYENSSRGWILNEQGIALKQKGRYSFSYNGKNYSFNMME